MALRNVTIPTRTIKTGAEGEIEVRGISLSDLMTIVNRYGPQASMAFAKVQSADSLDVRDVQRLIGEVATEFPDMVAAAMALAADAFTDKNVAIMRRLPFNVQLEVIEAIFALTFAQEGDIKKLMGSLSRVLAEVSGALTSIQLPLASGIGESAVQ